MVSSKASSLFGIKPTRRMWTWAAVALIFIAAFIVYAPALNGRFLWDDDAHVMTHELRSVHGLYRIWFDLHATQQYYPLLYTAFWVEYQLWSDQAAGYHVTNVLLHAGVAMLMMFVLRRLGFGALAAFFAAAVFALHPVCVESVAWITEQKNTLSGVFYLSAMLVYLRFEESGEREPRHSSKTRSGGLGLYWAALGLFVLGLLTKTVIATLPAALLVIIWWKRGRLSWKRDVKPLVAWFVLGVVGGLFTAWFEYELVGAQGEKFDLSALERFLLAGRVVWFYLVKLFWPVELTFIYPRWNVDAGEAWQWAFAVVLAVVLIWLGVQSRRWRGPMAAMLLFIGTLFPVLGFFNVYPFIFSYVADHFQYLALMSVISLVVGLMMAASARAPVFVRGAVYAGLSALVILLGAMSYRQSGMYTDLMTLYTTTLERNPDCWLAHNNIASELRSSGDFKGAIRHYERALELRPDYARSHNGLAAMLRLTGRPEEALVHIKEAVRYKPYFAEAHYNYGLILVELGRPEAAIKQFAEALAQKRDYVEAMNNLGVLYAQTGRFEEAIRALRMSLAHEPDRSHVLTNLAMACDSAGRSAEAMAAAEKALELARAGGREAEAAKIRGWIESHKAGAK